MVPVAPEQSAPLSNGSEVDTRPLVPPTVSSLSDGESDSEDDYLEDAAASLVREIESLRKSGAFPALESFEDIDQKRDTYLGPTMESNWVLPGKLLVGAYPASMNDSHHAHLLCTILLQGVSTFICLQQEYKAHGVTETMWRSGEALRPYFQDVLQLLRKLQELRDADPQAVPAVSSPESTDFVHFPIVDCNVADDTKVLQLAAQLAARIARGEILYLHCWGGHGRTGTVVSIMLHLMYGLGAEESMERCQHVHDVRRIPISVASPQTEAQREQVRRVIARLIRKLGSGVPAKTAPLPMSPAITMRSRPTSPLVPSTAETSQHCSVNTKASGPKALTTVKAAVDDEAASSPPAQAAKPCVSVTRTGVTKEGTDGRGETGTRCQGTTAIALGGRRGWVRGRREAFAPAPNGVGEDSSCWSPGEESVGGLGPVAVSEGEERGARDEGVVGPSALAGVGEDGEGMEEDGNVVEEVGSENSLGRRLRPRTSWRENEGEGGVPGEGCGGGGGGGDGGVISSSGSSSSRGRRKSFLDPSSFEEEGEASRGARSNRLRRKSAPGQSPRSAELDMYRTNSEGAAKEMEEQPAPELVSSVSAVDVSSSAGSRLGVGRCSMRSGAVRGMTPVDCVGTSGSR